MSAREAGDAGRARRRDLATAVAVAGVLVTLIFNTVGVWRAERQASGARIATEVGLLTQVGDGANRAARALVATGANDRRCKPAGLTLTDREQAGLFAALTYYDYLAWLFNDGHVTRESARDYWGPDLVDVYKLARHFIGTEVDALYEDLSVFARSAPDDLVPPDPCR